MALKHFFGILVFALTGIGSLAAADAAPATDAVINQLWDFCVKTYHSPDTGMFYGRAPKDIPPPSAFPTREQYRKGQYRTQPYKKGDENTVGFNSHGGGSGLEDSSLFTGTLLGAICDKYLVTQSPNCREEARMTYRGLHSAATAHGEPGFIARGVSPADGKTIPAGSSRDQYTNALYGMWRYYRSGLADNREKAEIRQISAAVADKMLREITPANNYSFTFAFGVPDDRGVAKMFNPQIPALGFRLAMFYAVAADVNGNPNYRAAAEKYLTEALKGMQEQRPAPQSKRAQPAYVILQSGYAYDVLTAVFAKSPHAAALTAQAKAEVARVLATPEYALTKGNVRCKSEVINGLLKTHGGFTPTPEVWKVLNTMVKVLGPRGKGYPDSNYNLIGAYWAARAAGAK